MESTPDTSSAKRTRAKPKVLKESVETQSAAVKKPRAPRKSPTTKPATADVSIVAATMEPSTEDETIAGPITDDVGSMVATAAYYLAAARNFSPGHELDDWLEAERLIHAKLYG